MIDVDILHSWLVFAIAIAARQDTTIVAAVRAVATREPVEAFKSGPGLVRVRDIQLLDVDDDGSPEAFVWIDPSFLQTPTILVYTYHRQHGARRLLEGLVPGQLRPVSGRFTDDHALGFGLRSESGDEQLMQAARDLGIAVERGGDEILALRNAGVVPVDLETTYAEACRRSRLTEILPRTNA